MEPFGLAASRSAALAPGTGPHAALHRVRPAHGGPPQLVRLLAAGTGPTGLDALVTGRDGAGRLLLETPRGALLLEAGPDLAPGARLRLVPATATQAGASPHEAQNRLAIGADRVPPLPRASADGPLAPALVRLLASTSSSGREPRGGTAPGQAEAAPPALRVLDDGWRLALLLLTGQPDEVVRVYRRDESPGSDGSVEQEATSRLVLEVDWSRLGRTQLDLLARGPRIDLKIRTERPLPGELVRAIEEVFVCALAVGGLTGSLAFVSEPAKLPEPGPLTSATSA